MNDERTKAAATAALNRYLMQHRLRRTPERHTRQSVQPVGALFCRHTSPYARRRRLPCQPCHGLQHHGNTCRCRTCPTSQLRLHSGTVRKSGRHNQPPPPRMHTVRQGQGGQGCRNRPAAVIKALHLVSSGLCRPVHLRSMLPMRTTTEAVSQKQRIKFDTNHTIS